MVSSYEAAVILGTTVAVAYIIFLPLIWKDYKNRKRNIEPSDHHYTITRNSAQTLDSTGVGVGGFILAWIIHTLFVYLLMAIGGIGFAILEGLIVGINPMWSILITVGSLLRSPEILIILIILGIFFGFLRAVYYHA